MVVFVYQWMEVQNSAFFIKRRDAGICFHKQAASGRDFAS
jgi:hypothetical protein